MQIKSYTGPHTYYAEVGQTNSLRWVVLQKQSDDVFVETSKPFKCKDFFNEIVAKYHGHILGCYGFTAAPIPLQEEGVWVELRHITSKPAFEANIGTINKFAAKYNMPPVNLLPSPNGYVCLLDRKYFENTYMVSLLTYLIRIANVDVKIQDETFMEHPTKNIDSPFANVYAEVMQRGFKLPEMKFKPSYYSYGPKNDYTEVPMVGKVHNCGVAQWSTMAKLAA